jgi:hypothetical protein
MNIYEEIFPIQHPLVKRTFEVDATTHEGWLGQFMYLDYHDPKIISARLTKFNDDSIKLNNTNRLNLLLKYGKDYDACLIIATFIYSEHYAKIRKVLNAKNQFFDEPHSDILKSTNGFILYDYQFEDLARLVLNTPTETAVALRKAFNRKKPLNQFCGVNEVKLIFFQQVLNQRLAFDTVPSANYSGANHLLSYARSIA